MGARILPLLAAVVLGLGLLASGCGNDSSDLSVVEGEPLELGDLSYNISISRFLNPADAEDRAYLTGQDPLPNDKLWLGVFMQIHNGGDAEQQVARDFVVLDTQGTRYAPLPSKSDFALRLGGPIEAHADLPEPESAAASGPIQGAMVLFQIDAGATENRPLTLDIPSAGGETGEVELDI